MIVLPNQLSQSLPIRLTRWLTLSILKIPLTSSASHLPSLIDVEKSVRKNCLDPIARMLLKPKPFALLDIKSKNFRKSFVLPTIQP